ncbi:MAG: hypothetical protein K9N55_06590 [Phycisphaerae bacterium]|nr:hypothetical protein [Phycisphaerae bacterium]
MAEMKPIDRVIHQICRLMNHHLWLTGGIMGLCAACGVLTIVGLCYLFKGRHIPAIWIPAVCLPCAIVTCVILMVRRRSLHDAAQFTDSHFQLKDSVCSYKEFSTAHKHGGVYDLQARQTQTLVEAVNPARVPYRWPLRLIAACVVLLLSSVWLTLKADSPRVVEARRIDAQILGQTEQINEQLKEVLEQIKDQIQKEDLKDLVDPEALDRKFEELKPQSDLKEAMREYAGLERELNQTLSRLAQRKDEKLYKQMGESLQEQDQTKALGNRLAEQQYKEAAKALQDYQIDPNADPEQHKQQIDKVKALAERMTQAAQRSPDTAQSKAAQLANQLNKAAQARKDGQSGSSSSSGSKSAQSGSQGSISKGSTSQSSGSSGSSGSEGSMGSDGSSGSPGSQGVNDALEQISDHLNDLEARSKAQSLIQQLCKSLSQGQCDLCNGQGNGNGKGKGKGKGKGSSTGEGGGKGPGIGTGSSSDVNPNINDTASTGDKSVLKGIKNQGPSSSSTETATEGTGTSTGSRARKIQQYEHQAESFIRREDVSAAVKDGVKAYFETIHRIDQGDQP